MYNILDGVKEAERVLYSDEDEDKGFMIVPDLKWDQTSMSALVSRFFPHWARRLTPLT